MKNHEPKHKTLTPMRALELLNDTHKPHADAWKLQLVRDALTEHIKAALVRSKRRKR